MCFHDSSCLTSQTHLSRSWCESLQWAHSLWSFKDSWAFHLSAWLLPSEPGQTSMIPYCTDPAETPSPELKSPRWDRASPLFPQLTFSNVHLRKSLSWTEPWYRFPKKETHCHRQPWHTTKPSGAPVPSKRWLWGACLYLKEDNATGVPVLTILAIEQGQRLAGSQLFMLNFS